MLPNASGATVQGLQQPIGSLAYAPTQVMIVGVAI